MAELQNLMESVNAKVAAQEKKWESAIETFESTGLLEGLSDKGEKGRMATLLENQVKQLITEAGTNTNLGGASFTTGTGEQWAGVALPMVRKIFHETISAKEFVSFQTMSLPSGLVFYLDYKYATDKKPFVSGQSVYGTTNVKDTAPTGGFYGVGRYTYSENDAEVSVTGTASSASYAEVGFNSNLSASVAAGGIKKVSVAVSGLPDYDIEGIRGFVISGSGTTPSILLQEFTTYNTAGTNIEFFVSGSAVTGTVQVTYHKQTKDNFRGDFEDRDGTDLGIPEFKVELRSETITAKTRKLKASWTMEAMQDIQAYQAIDIEQEMTSLMSDHIGMEIDLEVLDMLRTNVNTTDKWTAENNKTIKADGSDFTAMPSGYYNSQGQWFQTLGTKLNKVSNIIHQKTLRGGANWMVVSPMVATVLESIPGFSADGDGSFKEFNAGVQKIGSFNSKFKVYKNPYYTQNEILMGFKGSSYLETGAVFATYVPLLLTPLVYDPVNFTPRKGLFSRYAKKMLRPEFYASITIGGLETI
jgi:hypothetical protein